MIIAKRQLPRRTFLKGVMGTAVALPLLDAMVPAATAQSRTAAAAPFRFGAVYFPNGAMPNLWTPNAAGPLELPPMLGAFAPVREHVNVVSGLAAAPLSEHHSATSLWLHGGAIRKTEGPDVSSGKTIDQFIAESVGQETPMPSLEIGVEDMSGSFGMCAFGYSCIYMNSLAWRTPTAPLPMELNPRTVFERLFGDTGTPAERAARRKSKRSILDSVIEAAGRLRSELGPQDARTMTEYLDNIREVERRIQLAEKQFTASDADILPSAPSGVPASYEEHVTLLYDLVALAFRSDTTRVFTFMKGVEASPISFPQIGVPESHHIVSHHQGSQESIAKYAKVNAYQASLFAAFVDKLRATPDGDGSLLDHTFLMYGSAMSNGNVHDRNRLPILVAGGAGGRMKGGRHVVTPNPTPLANLLVSIADKAGLEIDQIGNSTGRVDL